MRSCWTRTERVQSPKLRSLRRPSRRGVLFSDLAEHGRYDPGLEIAGRVWRVRCKWGALAEDGAFLKVSLQSNYCTPAGYLRASYSAREIDLVAAYCDALDRCYLLPVALVACRTSIALRLTPPRNGQRGALTSPLITRSLGL